MKLTSVHFPSMVLPVGHRTPQSLLLTVPQEAPKEYATICSKLELSGSAIIAEGVGVHGDPFAFCLPVSSMHYAEFAPVDPSGWGASEKKRDSK